MASIILGTAGEAVGSVLGGAAGGQFGRALGSLAGRAVDQAVFDSETTLPVRHGARLSDLAVQVSTYGKMLPVVYGRVRLAGNVIWSQPIRETATRSTQTAGGKGGGGKVSSTTVTYSYSVTLAISVCEGEIDSIHRIWADAKLLDFEDGSFHIFDGTEDQLPSSVIEAFEGTGHVPAYRGQAYVVIEDFPLADYGNRIPNFTFEVERKLPPADTAGAPLEEKITAVTLIPASGEFAYDTVVQMKVTGIDAGGGFYQTGGQEAVNRHHYSERSDALVSIDQMAEALPNLEWVSVVIGWFGTSTDAGDCTIRPGVEYSSGAITQPDEWAVAGYTRSTAHAITQESGSPIYGGTPNDDGVLRLVQELKSRGYKVCIYPFLFMDMEGKPWRGHITGSAAEAASFFTKTNGWNDCATHYANLLKDDIDAFVIGSEFKGLTAVTDAPGSYPAVDALVALAATIKGIVGSGVTVTYAADWSEYHHTDGGWYHLDPLWSSPNIDVVGIDAYFPLADAPQSELGYDPQAAEDGWDSGEGYDWYYTDAGRSTTAALSAPYAWKNIGWWWNNTHTNPDMSATGWTAQMKKIWFTELGFPSVDGAINQPNVFYDPGSSDSAFPYHSHGQADFRAQRQGLAGSLAYWNGSAMVEEIFIWTWDARPYPYWPDLTEVWSDGGNWAYGHWLNGKIGMTALSAVIEDLAGRAGVAPEDIDVSAQTEQVSGYALNRRMPVRAAIEALQPAYFFDLVESGGVIRSVPRGQAAVASVTESELAVTERGREALLRVEIVRQQEKELPQSVNLLYMKRTALYQAGNRMAVREHEETHHALTLDLPLVLSDQEAQIIAEITLAAAWTARTGYRFRLPPRYSDLDPGDVVTLTVGGIAHSVRLTRTLLTPQGLIECRGVAEDSALYTGYAGPGEEEEETGTSYAPPPAATTLEALDLPLLPGEEAGQGAVYFAAAGLGAPWRGTVLYESTDGGVNYTPGATIQQAAILGHALTALPDAPAARMDLAHTVDVALVGDGELESITGAQWLAGGNAALLGDEVIQFESAVLQGDGSYRLSGLLRGRLGSEWAATAHTIGERFVLLNGALHREGRATSLLGLTRYVKPVTVGSTLGATTAQSYVWQGRSFKPYAPVHLRGMRNGSGDLDMSWVRRTRAGGEWRDNVDAALSEAAESYEIEILDGETVVRTIAAASPALTYTAAQQTTDFGAPQSSVTVRVYQLSEIIGRGYGASADL